MRTPVNLLGGWLTFAALDSARSESHTRGCPTCPERSRGILRGVCEGWDAFHIESQPFRFFGMGPRPIPPLQSKGPALSAAERVGHPSLEKHLRG
jgi:hypothetical protein